MQGFKPRELKSLDEPNMWWVYLLIRYSDASWNYIAGSVKSTVYEISLVYWFVEGDKNIYYLETVLAI